MQVNKYTSTAQGKYFRWPRRPTLASVNAMYFFAIAALVIASFVPRALSSIWSGATRPLMLCLVSFFYQAVFLFAPPTRFCIERPGAALGLRLMKPPLVPAVLSILAAIVGVMFSDNLGTLWLLLIQALGGQLPQRLSASAGLSWPIQLFFSALIPAICEEWMFRGAMLSAWERRGRGYALTVSTLMFCSMHANLAGFPIYLITGFAMGIITLCSGSIVTAMIYHFTHNAMLIILSGTTSPTAMLGGGVLYEMLGGAQGVWLTALRALTLGLLYVGLIAAVWGWGAKMRTRTQLKKLDKKPLDLSTIIILSAGIITALSLYLVDILTIWGVL